MPKNEEYESLDSSKENPVSSNIKNIETIQVKSWLKLKINPKPLDLEKLILVRSKSLSKKEITKRLIKNLIWAQTFLRMQWRLIFTIVLSCYRLRLWLGNFIYFKTTSVFF